jgi:hypothetical protein
MLRTLATMPDFSKQTRECNSNRSKNYRPSSTRSESACAYCSRPSSGSTRYARMAEVLEKELAMSIIMSLRTRRANP